MSFCAWIIFTSQNAAAEFEFVPFQCSTSGCMCGQGVMYNKETGEAYALFPSRESGKPLLVQINYLKGDKTGKVEFK